MAKPHQRSIERSTRKVDNKIVNKSGQQQVVETNINIKLGDPAAKKKKPYRHC